MTRVTLSNGHAYVIDPDTRRIAPDGDADPLVARHAENLLASDKLIGPQVDEFAGIRGTWNDSRAPLAAMVDAAHVARLSVVAVDRP